MKGKKITEINNSETVREFEDAANIQLKDRIRRKIKPDVQAVININPKDYRVIDIVKFGQIVPGGSADVLIYAPSANKDFYLKNISISGSSGSTSVANNQWVRVTINGEATNIINLALSIGVEDSNTASLTFDSPIKIDRGSEIRLQTGNSTGKFVIVNIFGYEVNVV